MEVTDVPMPVPMGVPALATERRFAQRLRECLEEERLSDGRFQLQRLPGGRVALPVLEEKLSQLCLPPEMPCELLRIQEPVPSRAARRCPPARRLRDQLRRLLGSGWSEQLERDVPHAWQRHGDLVLLSEDSFKGEPWERLGKGEQGLPAPLLPAEHPPNVPPWCAAGPELWETVASALGARRVARRGRVMPDGMRTPRVTLLLGQHGWVEHVDNGIRWAGAAGCGCSGEGTALTRVGSSRYTFDVTKCMFSPGNITEKLRVASLPCSGEVLVDLYAGIGYFTLPFLVHAGAAFVHACEWNSHAVEALHRTLVLNGVRDRCHIHAGDSRQLQLRDVADRVNLGLIPSSEEGWPVACRVLRKNTGGVLHIHHNVETPRAPAPPQPAVLLAERSSPETASSGGEAQQPTEDGGEETLGARLRPEWQRWAEATATRIQGLLAELHGWPWRTSVLHVEVVKSYAPHVHHLVLDLECRPLLPD
ncbi:tRNA wybutosine-synthesizing protein 2 homolog isoform X2 [Poecile atricapillus]|uniref:tRNA wybutosine-synthesizing protein 2 homolog isoform X2 n=1 Tax=Poecile atricapillus TaxID=48891 RepID=UPI002739DE30|nr:tRNA wybutosine-synthesizing protein 2 homolog isoform X2 [Poecile atricapillus]